MIIAALTSAPLTGSGTIAIEGGLLGGYKLNADGTNNATLILRKDSASGDLLIDTNTVVGEHVVMPMKCSTVLYYSVAGVNADVMLFEAIRERV